MNCLIIKSASIWFGLRLDDKSKRHSPKNQKQAHKKSCIALHIFTKTIPISPISWPPNLPSPGAPVGLNWTSRSTPHQCFPDAFQGWADAPGLANGAFKVMGPPCIKGPSCSTHCASLTGTWHGKWCALFSICMSLMGQICNKNFMDHNDLGPIWWKLNCNQICCNPCQIVKLPAVGPQKLSTFTLSLLDSVVPACLSQQ